MRKPSPRTLRIILVTAVLSAGLTFAAMALWLRPLRLPVGAIDLAHTADGVYIGSCQNKLLTAVVQATVADHRLTEARVLFHKSAYMGPAQAVADSIVAAQSLSVDGVSGATLTARTVQKAVENALAQGTADDE